MITWKEQLKINEELLDKIDFTPYLEKSEYTSEIMAEVEANCPIELPADFEGNPFNFMTELEFANYLANRYNRCAEEIHTYWVPKAWTPKKGGE